MGNNKVRGRIKLGSISIKGRLLLPETMKNMPRYKYENSRNWNR
jgi:hypothetical protein